MNNKAFIKCDLCGHIFKTYSTIETHYHDYESEDEICYYPVPEENAHLVNNYICDDCYNKIGDIVLRQFIENGDRYNKELDARKLEAYKEYEKTVANLEDKNAKVLEITNCIKAVESILDLDDQTIRDLHKNFPYTTGATYYLDKAIDIEQRTKQNKKKVWEWADQYKIELSSENYFDMVDLETFKAILKDSKILNMSYKEINELIARM